MISFQKYFYVDISGIDENGEAAKHLQQYIDIAKYTDLNDPLFKELTKGIYDLTEKFYGPNFDPESPNLSSYVSIVGPSLMGKTQFAFSLARVCPVFYVNFASVDLMQSVYKAFDKVSTKFKNYLLDDVGVLENRIGSLNSDEIRDNAANIELKTIDEPESVFVVIQTNFQIPKI